MADTLALLMLGTQVCIFLASIIGLVHTLRNKTAIQEIHLLINSRLTEFKDTAQQLLSTSITAAHAAGVKQGREEPRNEKDGNYS